ncbi:MAG: hypothetical protein DRI57_01100 [Deltaproteobacteria bacterium]|nr:MAG: hypothetical protein DRI57_01100 [Deltaproteobacteria bacterium]
MQRTILIFHSPQLLESQSNLFYLIFCHISFYELVLSGLSPSLEKGRSECSEHFQLTVSILAKR